MGYVRLIIYYSILAGSIYGLIYSRVKNNFKLYLSYVCLMLFGFMFLIVTPDINTNIIFEIIMICLYLFVTIILGGKFEKHIKKKELLKKFKPKIDSIQKDMNNKWFLLENAFMCGKFTENEYIKQKYDEMDIETHKKSVIQNVEYLIKYVEKVDYRFFQMFIDISYEFNNVLENTLSYLLLETDKVKIDEIVKSFDECTTLYDSFMKVYIDNALPIDMKGM